jgi:hypothetical protein
VRAWELLAALTTTTTTSPTTTTSTTTTLVQAVGGQGVNSVSDVWVALLAALLGAIVGGMATLAASVLVKRWELKKTARIRMYDELMPALYREVRDWSVAIVQVDRGYEQEPMPPPTFAFLDRTGELHRAGVIAGTKEARISEEMYDTIMAHIAYGKDRDLVWRPDIGPRELSALNKELERLFDDLEQHLKRKLARQRRWRLPVRGGRRG